MKKLTIAALLLATAAGVPASAQVNAGSQAPEASELHGSGQAHEHIGQLLLTAEASKEKKREKSPEKPVEV